MTPTDTCGADSLERQVVVVVFDRSDVQDHTSEWLLFCRVNLILFLRIVNIGVTSEAGYPWQEPIEIDMVSALVLISSTTSSASPLANINKGRDEEKKCDQA